MLLIRISGKDYTFSREAWAALVGATRSRYYCTCDFASMYPSAFRPIEFKRPDFTWSQITQFYTPEVIEAMNTKADIVASDLITRCLNSWTSNYI